MSTFNELIDFTRSTTGTYLDSVVYGDELVTNGDFATDSDWIKTGNLTAISNGTVTIGETAGNGSIRQEDALITGKSYIVKFDITAVSSASAFLAFRNDEIPSVSSAVISFGNSLSVATYSKVFVATGSIVNFTVGGGNTSLAIDNISVKEVIGGQVSGTPLLRTAAINEPRLEYDASGNPLGLLIEEARTNLLTNSNVPPSGGGAVLVKNAIAPNGAQDAWTMTYSSGVGYNAPSGASFISGTAYTFSFYFKRGTGTQQIWTLLYGAVFNNNGGNVVAIYDIESETATINVSGATANVQDVGNGWYRCSCSAIATASSTSGQQIYRQGATEAGKYDYVYGFQVEAGAFPTSYIPTSGSAVTRAADFARLPVERFAYNQPQGSIVCHFNYFFESGNSKRAYEFSDGTDNNVIRIIDHNNVNQLQANFKSGGAGVAGILINAPTMLSGVKTFQTYKLNGYSGGADGTLAGTDSNGLLPVGINKLSIGSRRDGAATMSGHITSLQYYPKKLTDAQLELLTQPSASPTMNLTFDGQATSTLVEGLHD